MAAYQNRILRLQTRWYISSVHRRPTLRAASPTRFYVCWECNFLRKGNACLMCVGVLKAIAAACTFLFRFNSVYSGVTSARGERNIKIERQSVSYCMDGLGLLQARTLTKALAAACTFLFRFHSVYSGVTSARGERNIKIDRQSVSYCMDGLGLLQAHTLTTPLRTMQHSCSLLTAVLPVLLLLTKWSRVTLKPPF